MKKKIAVICALVFVLSSFAQSVSAIDVILNSATVHFPDQEPVIENWVTLVPLRPIADALGLEIGWDDPTDTVTLKKDNFFIELVIGSTKAKTSSGEKTLLTPPVIINSRTMVPLRFIAEELGLKVSWNMEKLRVIIVGQVDTKNIPTPPVEKGEDSGSETTAGDASDEAESTEIPVEDETENINTAELTSIEAPSSSITFEISDLFYPEDTASEESFAFRSIDAFDAQHSYNWDLVSRYESYADESAKSGILFIVQELEPYTGEEYDVASALTREYPQEPERPERPQTDFDYDAYNSERGLLIARQLFKDMGKEEPEGLEESPIIPFVQFFADMPVEWLESIEVAQEVTDYFGMTKEELKEQIDISKENIDESSIPGHEEYLEYLEAEEQYNAEMQIYREEHMAYQAQVAEVNAVRNYAVRTFSENLSKLSDEDWATLFATVLNTDEEVRYEGVELLDFNGKKVVHATVFAEDPDDEQGAYQYYRYQDSDTLITIFGGTLYSSEPSPEITEILANISVE